jgi:hypothetical protein
MMTIEEALRCIGEPEKVETLRPHWDESSALLSDEIPLFLLPAAVARHREWCGFGLEADEPLREAAAQIAASPALRLLAWHCYRLLFVHTEYADIERWPSLETALCDLRGVFYLLVALAMVPRVITRHRELGIPEEVSRETCLQVRCFSENYRRGTQGRLGIFLQQLYWLRHYPAGRLFRLGRFEYRIMPYSGSIEVYRHRDTGEVLALAPNGMHFNTEGYAVRAANGIVQEPDWTATRVDTEETVGGYPFSPCGMAVRREVHLPRATWELVLSNGDDTLDMHIPAGGGMMPEHCADSMRRAVAFFREHFPECHFAAITCSSWIFNTQLDGILPPEANLVAFQRELYLFTVPSSPTSGLWFLFLQTPFDPATAPRDTALQRAVLDFLAAGHTWRGGAMFLLVEHLDRFGTQYYRSNWPPTFLR